MNEELLVSSVRQHELTEKAQKAEERARVNETRLAESQMRLAMELSATQRLQEVSTQLIGEGNPDALYGQIMDAAMAIMRSQYASIHMYFPDRGDLRLMGYRGFNLQAAEFWEWVSPASENTCGMALRTGERVVVRNIEGCDWMAGSDDQAIYVQTGIHAAQTTPLVSRTGRMLGMISTYWRQPHQASERDLRLLDVLARQAADLIERSHAEEALRDSEEKYRSLFNSIDEGFCTVEMIFDENEKPVDYRFLELNPAFVKQTGLEDATGKRMREIAPLHEEHWFEIYGRVAMTGESFRFENRAEELDAWYDVFALRVGEAESRKVAIIFNNITERKQMEEGLRRAKEELEIRVVERTADLAEANENLKVENQERKRTEEERGRILHQLVTAQEDGADA